MQYINLSSDLTFMLFVVFTAYMRYASEIHFIPPFI